MSERPTLVFSLLGDIAKNSRAVRQINALTQELFQVQAFGFGTRPGKTTLGAYCKLTTFPYPESRGPALFIRTHQVLARALRTTTAHVYHASDLYTLRASRQAAKRNSAQLTYDARELYTHVQSLKDSAWKRRVWTTIERADIKHCKQVYTVSDSIADYLAQLHNIHRPLVIPNTPDLEGQRSATTDLRSYVKDPNHLILLHNGQIRDGRGCINLVKAIAMTNNTSVVFLGDGPLKKDVLQLAASLSIEEKVVAVDPVPPNEIIATSRTATAGAVMLEDTCLNHRLALPNKLFEYAAAGLPVIASNLPEISEIVGRFEAGVLVNADHPADIARGINMIEKNPTLAKKLGENSSSILETFNWKNASQAFLNPFRF